MEIKHNGTTLTIGEAQARAVWEVVLDTLKERAKATRERIEGKPKRKYTRKIFRTRWNKQDRELLKQLDTTLANVSPLARKIDAIRAHLPNRTPQAIWAQLRREQEAKQTNTTTN